MLGDDTSSKSDVTSLMKKMLNAAHAQHDRGTLNATKAALKQKALKHTMVALIITFLIEKRENVTASRNNSKSCAMM